MKWFAIAVLMLSACGEPPKRDEAPSFIGAHGLVYRSAEDAAALDEAAALTGDALVRVFGEDARAALSGIVITYDDTLPAGVDGAATPSGVVSLRRYACPGYGSLAHEVAHLVALRVTGDGDSGHHDTRLFLDDCKTNACAWSSVEMVPRVLCD